MVEVTNELIFEILKKIQDDVAHIRRKVDMLEQRVTTIENHLAAFHNTINRHEYDMSDMRHRIERIERRLELTDS